MFLYAVPTSMTMSIESWVAIYSHSINYMGFLFNTSIGNVTDLPVPQEHRLKSMYNVPTIGQRCVDWFRFGGFRLTGRPAGSVLHSYATIMLSIGHVSV